MHLKSKSGESKSREEVIDDWVAQQSAIHRGDRKKRRLPTSDATVTINSLMDAMMIVLVFLLMNYSVDPLRIDSSDELELPASATELSPEASSSVTVTKSSIVVNDQLVVQIKEGTIDKAFKQGEETSLQIQPLFEALNEEATRQKNMAQLSGGKFTGVLTIIADQETPYRLLTEVLYTAGQAEFQKFKFAVIRGGRRGSAG